MERVPPGTTERFYRPVGLVRDSSEGTSVETLGYYPANAKACVARAGRAPRLPIHERQRVLSARLRRFGNAAVHFRGPVKAVFNNGVHHVVFRNDDNVEQD